MEKINIRQVARFGLPADVVLIDLRSKADFQKGHLDCAINIPYEKLKLEHINFARGRRLAFYCCKGLKSRAAADFYEHLGYKTIDLTGGYESLN